MEAREPKFRPPVKPAQFAEPNTGVNCARPAASRSPSPPANQSQLVPPGRWSIRSGAAGWARGGPRLSAQRQPLQVQAFPNPANNERSSVQLGGQPGGRRHAESRFGRLSADRLVMWTRRPREPLMGGEGMVQSDDTPLELYLEGNIVFRQGDRVLYAQRMYYDVRRQVGVVLDAEMLRQRAHATTVRSGCGPRCSSRSDPNASWPPTRRSPPAGWACRAIDLRDRRA